MPSPIKVLLYRAARRLGLFRLARSLTRDRLRILAYHGFGRGDVLGFQPKLFIAPETFAQRMELLGRRGFRVIGLDEAVTALREGHDVGDAVVITIDDGYASTLELATPILKRHGLPATVYVTTYHVLKQTPVFDLVVAYMVWKTTRPILQWGWPGEPALQEMALLTGAEREAATDRLLDLGHRVGDESARIDLCRALGEALGVSYEAIVASGAFRLMSVDEVRHIADEGVSVELHTHRHRFPADDAQTCRRELAENEAELARITGRRARHFCYPSGRYDPRQWPWLEAAGVQSATTCDTGLVRPTDPVYGLKRFLDGEMVHEVEFDAEVCGFAELLRGSMRIRRPGGQAA